MYNPKHFEETRPEVMHSLIAAQPLCTLVTLSADGLVANQIPMLLRRGAAAAGATPDAGDLGTLVAHVARANPLWTATDFSMPVLAIFQGPQAYISPGWYATKAEHGKVVPTWNYVVVQASGVMTVHDDPEWIRAQASELTGQQEAQFPKPWAVDDAPRAYTDTMLRALVGIEIPITRLTGKWKVSQNQPAANRESLVEALQSAGTADARAVADLVVARQPGTP
jgi:transcriptional regulator